MSTPDERPSPSDQRTRVLVVDDHELSRRGLLLMLAQEIDIEVVGETNDAAAALELAAHLQPDLVLVDLRAFGASAIETCRAIAAAASGARMILLTADGVRADSAIAEAAGAEGWLRADTSLDEVTAAIRSAVAAPLPAPFRPLIVQTG